MDDNMGFGSPNFFGAAWDPEQIDNFFTGGCQSNVTNYANYVPQFQQGQAEYTQLNYFSNPQDSFNQSGFQPKYQTQSQNGDLDLILASSKPPEPQSFSTVFKLEDLDQILAYSEPSEPQYFLEPSVATSQMQVMATYGNPTVFGVTGNSMAKPTSPSRLNDTGSWAQSQKESKESAAKSKQHDSATASKPTKPRKSKKKPSTKENEEVKRNQFLERNRVAADKYRQKRKKWIDDLQAKAHFFNADNAAKKALVKELEQEVLRLKSLLLIHFRTCNKNDIVNWVNQEARRVELEAQTKMQGAGLRCYAKTVSDAVQL
jgi:hypothetical protein